jgi:hypothetical protein
MACSEVESNTSGITEGRLCGLSGTTGTGEVNSLDHRMHFKERGRLHKPAPQGQAGATNLKQHSEDSFTSTYGSAYTCVTQHACQISIRALSLNVIGPGNLIARWAHGSRLSYFVSSKGLSNVLLEPLASTSLSRRHIRRRMQSSLSNLIQSLTLAYLQSPSSLEMPGRSSISVLSCSKTNTKIISLTSSVTSLATSSVYDMNSAT